MDHAPDNFVVVCLVAPERILLVLVGDKKGMALHGPRPVGRRVNQGPVLAAPGGQDAAASLGGVVDRLDTEMGLQDSWVGQGPIPIEEVPDGVLVLSRKQSSIGPGTQPVVGQCRVGSESGVGRGGGEVLVGL